MSTASKVTLGLTTAAALGVIAYVHFKQASERAKLHEGVLRDEQRVLAKRAENILMQQQQTSIEKMLRAHQDSPQR